ncbi:hypothetical protein [Roseobacter sp.]|uniref:hypothetical protein n=1 Tax=Roseobacter sp. TaxID=1907202 RepID=UPI0029672BE5|nr:hypothetical protein [Roseobacter sp.]MDW3181776.1 hypothetical protein [Roseobacter sp.]
MAVIVPQANTPFQQTRQPRQQFDEPDVAGAIGGIADIAVQYGVDQVQHERATAMQNARVTAVERLGALRDQYEQDPNLDGLSQRFTKDVEAVRDELLETLPAGRLREDFELDFRQMASPQARAIGRRQYALQRDSALAGLNASLRTYTQEAAAAPDQDARDAILQSAASDIGAAEAAGWLSATDAEALTAGTYGDVISTSALKSMQDDPQEFLDRAEEGEFADMDPARLVQLSGQAKRAVAAENARQLKASALAAKEADKMLRADVEEAVEVIEGGLRYDQIGDLLDRAKGTEYEHTLRATLAAAATEGNFAIIDPVDQRAVIAQLEQTVTRDPEDVARLNRLRAMHDKTVQSLADDQLSHVSNRGMVQLAPVSLDDPDSIRARIATAEAVAQDIKTDTPQLRYFTNGERDAIRAEIERGDPDAQLALATSLVTGFGDRAAAVLEEVGAQDPTFHLAGQLVAQTSDIAAARTMLTGRQLLKGKTGAKAPTGARQSLRAEFTAAFPPADRQRLVGLFEAADAHFASAGLAVDPDADEETQRAAYLQSIQAVSGAVTRRGVSYGGIQEVHGQQTLLPPVMTAETVEMILDQATPEAWRAASLGGGSPMLGGRPLPDPDTRRGSRAGMKDLKLMSMGGGRYLVGVTRSDGSHRWLTDGQSADGLYYVDLETLQRSIAGGER